MEIHFEPGLTEEQKEMCLVAHYMDRQDKVRKAHANPLWNEARSVVGDMKRDILLEHKRENLAV